MSQDNGLVKLNATQTQVAGYRWLQCRGCGGEVGIPTDWAQETVECPECLESIRVKCSVLYRRPGTGQTTTASEPKTASTLNNAKQPSEELEGYAQNTLI